MYSVKSTDRLERCGHDKYYEGCLSCLAHSREYQLEEAITQVEKIKGVIKSGTDGLAQPALTKKDRARYQTKVERATKQLESWKERVDVMREEADSVKKQMESLCAGVDPSLLPATFKRHADGRAEEHARVWRSKAPTEAESEFVEFRRETANHPGSFKGLERSKIEATPDCLVKDGIGLQVFLKGGKITDDDGKVVRHRLPTQAIGDQAGRAFMSYGAAIDMFGLPDAPGGDPDSDDEADADAEASLQDSMARCGIKEPEEPATELEFRLLSDSYEQTEPLLSEAEQWAMFQSGKFISDVSVLARQYVKLVEEKELAAAEAKKQAERKERRKKNDTMEEQSGVEEEVIVDDPAAPNGPWPAVEGLDWAGFTNWVKRCQDLDPKFSRVTLEWAKQRRGRRALIKIFEQSKAPADYDNGSKNHPDPRDYWRFEDKTLGMIDMARLGKNPTTVSKSNKGGR